MIRRAIGVVAFLLLVCAAPAAAQSTTSEPPSTTTPDTTTTTRGTTTTSSSTSSTSSTSTSFVLTPIPSIIDDVPTTASTVPPSSTTGAAAPFFANCDEAALAGLVNFGPSTPGYRAALDRDGDGVACETDELLIVGSDVVEDIDSAGLPVTGSSTELIVVLGLATAVLGVAWRCAVKWPRSSLR